MVRLNELEKLCVDLEEVDTQIRQKIKEVSDLEEKAKNMKEGIEVQRIMAQLRGEGPPVEPEPAELDKSKKELESLENRLGELKNQALKGMTELNLPVSDQLTIDSDGNLVATLEGGPYEKSVKFIADRFDSSVPLDIDDVLLHADRIIAIKVANTKTGAQKLLLFKGNIQRMARVSVGLEDPEIKKVVDYMHKGTYKDIWEAVGSRQKVVLEELYGNLGITETNGKKRVQNFFINNRKMLGNAFPFINTSPGVWKRTFFGSLVWGSYQTFYPSAKETRTTLEEAEKKSEDQGTVKRKIEPKIQPLNKYMESEKLDKILYGNTGE